MDQRLATRRVVRGEDTKTKLTHLANWLDRRLPYIFILPALIFVAVLIAYPLVYTIWLSLQRWTVVNTTQFVGLGNYLRVLSDPRVLRSFRSTALFVTGAVGLQMLIGVGLALVLNREFSGRNFVRTLFLIPQMATPVAVAMVWSVMLDSELGILNVMLKSAGLPPVRWLSKELALFSVIMVDAWKHAPFTMLVTLGGLATLPEEIFEAARIDGASRWQSFWRITFPLLLPTLMVALLFRTITALQAFDMVFVITAGGPEQSTEVVSLLAYTVAFDYNRFGDAAAVLVLLGVAILALSLTFLRLRRVSFSQ
jgi:multiple sugar transport system permease protein